jgi:hypothetical protein
MDWLLEDRRPKYGVRIEFIEFIKEDKEDLVKFGVLVFWWLTGMKLFYNFTT